MGNHATTGPFAPIVVVTKNAMGVKEFNQFRGKMISLHSQGEPPRTPRAAQPRRATRRAPHLSNLYHRPFPA